MPILSHFALGRAPSILISILPIFCLLYHRFIPHSAPAGAPPIFLPFILIRSCRSYADFVLLFISFRSCRSSTDFICHLPHSGPAGVMPISSVNISQSAPDGFSLPFTSFRFCGVMRILFCYLCLFAPAGATPIYSLSISQSAPAGAPPIF